MSCRVVSCSVIRILVFEPLSQIVYKRYASLYFCCAIENTDNELLTLEIIHRYVELLDKYFGSVCELDIIFNFEKVGRTLLWKPMRDSYYCKGDASDIVQRI